MGIPNHIKFIAVFFSILMGGIGGFIATKIIFSLDTIELMGKLVLNYSLGDVNFLYDVPVFFTFCISFLVISFITSTLFAVIYYIG